MWTPANRHGLPTAEEAARIKSEIMELEVLLIEAQLRVDNLKQELEARRAWLVPVRRLTYDTLVAICEVCGEDWRTLVQMTAVCRRWREAALATPRAWRFLNLKQSISQRFLNLYFQRSKNAPLQICLDHHNRTKTIEGEVHRIQHLCVYSIYPGSFKYRNLHRLAVHTTDLNMACFPVLRHLRTAGPFLLRGGNIDGGDHMRDMTALLETLALVTGSNLAWRRALQFLGSTLVSLELTTNRGCHPAIEGDITLPRLRFVEFIDQSGMEHTRSLKLKTPVLESYVQRENVSALHVDENKIRNMHVQLATPPDLWPLVELRRLQLEGGIVAAVSVLDQLIDKPSLCPNLQVIEVKLPNFIDGLPSVTTKLAELNSHRDDPVEMRCIEFSENWPDLPGAIDGIGCVSLASGISYYLQPTYSLVEKYYAVL